MPAGAAGGLRGAAVFPPSMFHRAARDRLPRGSPSRPCGRSRCRCSATCTPSLRFPPRTPDRRLTRDIRRGTRSIGSLISYTPYSILPTLVEIGLVIGILLVKYEPSFAIITLVTLSLYVVFTFKVTNWRTALRRQANELTPPPTPAPSTA